MAIDERQQRRLGVRPGYGELLRGVVDLTQHIGNHWRPQAFQITGYCIITEGKKKTRGRSVSTNRRRGFTLQPYPSFPFS